ncbi:uncharacterized protein LOC143631965 [Bidens hawaiensis]|uniref:uncharacterized protein LOC143631965 n=1 Tax=Bidens hawaiensis TaxID=980011 RepID=UPI004048F686
MSRLNYPNDDYVNSLIAEDGLSYEEALLLQENIYKSFQEPPRNNNLDTHDDGANNLGHRAVGEGERLRSGEMLSYFAIDEDLARSLQELGDEFDNLLIHGQSHNARAIVDILTLLSSGAGVACTTTSHAEIPSWAHASSSNSRQNTVDPSESSSSNLWQDDIDPDSMPYEAVLEATESVGVESNGVPKFHISKLQTSKYKSGGLLKRKKKET